MLPERLETMRNVERRIGHIRLGELLGRGGMGAVYLGYDEKLQRQVAVKAVRSSRLDGVTRARFLAEARILSRLDHPNICRIHDYLEEGGEGFLVLERLRGESLARRIREGPPLRNPLMIAERIASALVLAHAKGVVHRDLKPANVMLVADGASSEVPKVLDFGLARLDGGASSDSSHPAAPPGESPYAGSAAEGDDTYWLPSVLVDSERGAVVGTPTNMSPEQARGEPATAASDMFSFGLLLQELLTGRAAYPRGIARELLLIKASEGDTLPVDGVDDDLRQLVEMLKSLAPEARPTAAEAVDRLRRIRDKPRRRRRAMLGMAIVVGLLAGGLKYALDLRQERNLALVARDAAEQASREAEAARGESQEVTAFLVDLFATSDPWLGAGQETTARQLLERGRERIAEQLRDRPRIRARLLSTLGAVYLQLGALDDAENLLNEAIEVGEEVFQSKNRATVAETLHALAILQRRRGSFGQAESLNRRALEIFEQTVGPLSAEVATIANNLGAIYDQTGEYRAAEESYWRALKIRRRILSPDDPELGMTMLNLAMARYELDELDAAESGVRQALDLLEEALGPENPIVARGLNSLGLVFRAQGKTDELVGLSERALRIYEGSLGPEHYETGIGLLNLASAYRTARRMSEAEATYLRAVRDLTASVGGDHHLVGGALNGLATTYREMGRLAEAESSCLRALEVMRGTWAEDHPRVASALANLRAIREARMAGEAAKDRKSSP